MALPSRSEHHLAIVRNRTGGPEVLLVEDRGRLALPRIESEERRSADVAELAREVRSALGLEVSVLRCLADEPGDVGGPRRHVYALEAHGPPDITPSRARWASWTEVCAALGGDRRLLDRLGTFRPGEPVAAPPAPGSSTRPGDERDWEHPGWRGQALAWVAGELALRGLPPVRGVEQLRVWEYSNVLRLTTDAGHLYFKARPPFGRAEPLLTRRLAERHPQRMPRVVAVEPHRRWLLMSETPGPTLMAVSDLGPWETAASAIAHVQLDWLDRTDELIGLGCPRWTLAALEAEIAPLLDDGPALQPDRADRLTDAQVATLRGRRAELEALCRELDRAVVPAALEHGDLWGDHVIAGPGAPVFIDWEDAAVAHPFFTPSLLLLSLDYTDALTGVPDASGRIREAYLRPWTERGPLAGWPARRLAEAFDLAQRVALLHYAVQFRLGLPRIETSWEVRAFTPLFLRHLAAR